MAGFLTLPTKSFFFFILIDGLQKLLSKKLSRL